jgi:hypothetical protein
MNGRRVSGVCGVVRNIIAGSVVRSRFPEVVQMHAARFRGEACQWNFQTTPTVSRVCPCRWVVPTASGMFVFRRSGLTRNVGA